MKYAVISDIHANLEALNAVIDYCVKKKVDKYVCLGDIVGYGANPVECIKKIKSLKGIVLVGNHDHAAIGITDITFFNSHARAAVEWTRDALSEKDVKFLTDLPFVAYEGDMTLVHASLDSPEMWHYVLNDTEAAKNIELLDSLLCFIGHSHVPCLFQEHYNSKALFDFMTQFTISEKTIINVGSVGQPRDGDPRASFVIYDTDSKLVSFERIDYDIKTAQQKIIKAGLPKILATRLSIGK